MVRLPYTQCELRKWGCFGSKATSGLCQPLKTMMPLNDTYIEIHIGKSKIYVKIVPFKNSYVKNNLQGNVLIFCPIS